MFVYNMRMTKNTHLPSKLSRILCDIEDKLFSGEVVVGCRDAYTDACVDYSVHGLNMPDSLAEYHIRSLETRFPVLDGQG
jgi:hypothetical protein